MLFPRAGTQVGGVYRSLRLVFQRNFGLTAVALQETQRKASNPIQQAFVDKIREYASKEKNARGKLVDATSEQQKSYDEELERISRVYQIKPDEAVKFPEMRFQDPKLETPGVDFDLKQGVVLKANDPTEAKKKKERIRRFRRNDVVSE